MSTKLRNDRQHCGKLYYTDYVNTVYDNIKVITFDKKYHKVTKS